MRLIHSSGSGGLHGSGFRFAQLLAGLGVGLGSAVYLRFRHGYDLLRKGAKAVKGFVGWFGFGHDIFLGAIAVLMVAQQFGATWCILNDKTKFCYPTFFKNVDVGCFPININCDVGVQSKGLEAGEHRIAVLVRAFKEGFVNSVLPGRERERTPFIRFIYIEDFGVWPTGLIPIERLPFYVNRNLMCWSLSKILCLYIELNRIYSERGIAGH